MAPLTLAAALLPAPLLAADSSEAPATFRLPTQSVVSRQSTGSIEPASAAATVFTHDDIERLQVQSVPELLNRVPGVVMAQGGGRGALSGAFIRGANPGQTLVLVDGVRINSAASGVARLEFLDPGRIERIEVIRGPLASQYGADAIGGLIRIFTRRGEPGLRPRLRLAVGNRGAFEREFDLAGSDERTRFDLGASQVESQGFDRSSDNRGRDADHDGFRSRALDLTLEHRFADNLQAGLNLLDQRGESELDDVYSFRPGDPYERFVVSSVAAHLEIRPSEAWTSRIETGHFENRSENRDDHNLVNNHSFDTYRDSLAWFNTLRLDERRQLLLGAEWYEERLHGELDYDETRRWNRAAFVRHSYRGEGLGVEIGLRHDDNQRFGSEESWSAALTLDLARATELILSYAEGFHAPSFSELYFPPTPLYGGNPDLAPERSKSYEIQLRGEHRGTHWSLSAYRTEVDDLIVETSRPGNLSDRLENIDRARLQGLELALSRDILGWRAALAASLVDPRDRDSGHTLPRRARRNLSLDLDRRFGAFSAGIGWQAVSSRYEDDANEHGIAGYALLGLRGSWQMSEALKWQVKIDNLLDKEYSQVLYNRPDTPFYTSFGLHEFRQDGRSALLSLTWTP
ncbi:TonB-dependent vitamin B12 receptor [Azotobacter vinelandii CA]|uniref:TonB-dependent vitamin B12 receptor n=3 Tax=Azotobacter TaxID=352 RepID=C1DLT3_AZOVD|nr:TonB-dependent vitamin B12 receptor [Azotobacter vinelandii DJ]AGK13297.1 TonB-dependent vitamin B12 receptor [Azotobacter vinelandii CA]AGK17621.1 TonB-dependent vitamin B12 receptor [Azotobacter vinelandii CA6]GLK59182.1 TonB-dependent receptor [Azotobacter vinelandii]